MDKSLEDNLPVPQVTPTYKKSDLKADLTDVIFC